MERIGWRVTPAAYLGGGGRGGVARAVVWPRLIIALLQLSRMELAIRVQVEELPEGLFLATSDELQGLIAQGRTVAETLEIARDVARKLLEARRDYTIVVAAWPSMGSSTILLTLLDRNLRDMRLPAAFVRVPKRVRVSRKVNRIGLKQAGIEPEDFLES